MSLIKQFQEQPIEQSIQVLQARLSSLAITCLEEMNQGTFQVVDLSTEQLDEAAGALGGLPKHIVHALVNKHTGGDGENSPVEITKHKTPASLKSHISDALKNGHTPIVHVNGKPHSAVVSNGNYYGGRADYQVHDSEKQKSYKETIHPKPIRSGGKIHYSASYEVNKKDYSKGDALTNAMPSHDKDFYKDNEVSVHVVHRDAARGAKQIARQKNRPELQHNTVKAKAGDNPNKITGYTEKRIVTSKTPAGNMDSIKKAAALKLAGKKLGDTVSSPNKEATDLHAEVAKHIASGDSRAATRALSALHDHIQRKGLSNSDDKKKAYAEALGELKSSWSKGSAKSTLARLRGENSEELTSAELELISEEFDQLDEESKEILIDYVTSVNESYSQYFQGIQDVMDILSQKSDEVLTESVTVHVDDGSGYGDKPNKKDADHVKAGAKLHSGVYDGASDKGVYFKFKKQTDAVAFKKHVSTSPGKTVDAQILDESTKYQIKAKIDTGDEGAIHRIDKHPSDISKKLGLDKDTFHSDGGSKYSHSYVITGKSGDTHSIYSNHGEVRIRPIGKQTTSKHTAKLKEYLQEDTVSKEYSVQIEVTE